MWLKILPVIFVFILGYILKQIKLLKQGDANTFLKLVYNIAIPALILISVSNAKLSTELSYLPVIACLVIFITFIISYLISKLFKFSRKTRGVFLVGSTILNTGFTLPFIIANFGNEGLAITSIFDFGNIFIVFSFVYFIACKYGKNDYHFFIIIKKVICSPPLVALFTALILNIAKISLPVIFSEFFKLVGNMTIPLVMLSLGLYFNLKFVKFKEILTILVIRMFFGLLLGLLFVALFQLEGLSKVIVIINSASPVGYNTIIFSSLEDLDTEFASSLVSLSILIGIFYIPLLIYLFS